MTVEYNETGNETLLKISPVEVEDEATYKCEITYLEVRENCDVVQIVKLTTLGKWSLDNARYGRKSVFLMLTQIMEEIISPTRKYHLFPSIFGSKSKCSTSKIFS